MIYGVISDIHANLEAMEAVLAELRGCDGFLCLGDIVGYGADPSACIERVRELPGLVCVAGNHDLAALNQHDREWFNPFARAAIEWTAGQLTPDDESYLAALPRSVRVEDATLVHGSLPEEMAYITSPGEARVCFDAMPSTLAFIGHTHVAEYYTAVEDGVLPRQASMWSGGAVSLESKHRYILNPGAVGQPRDANPEASFALWDAAAQTVEIKRVGYDVERAQGKMENAGLPAYLVQRLAVGR
jgi:diadenosine tetraphosphatase ApaH/serine/threonine PP2A family protein phosphatase